jgi:hypothetical protein
VLRPAGNAETDPSRGQRGVLIYRKAREARHPSSILRELGAAIRGSGSGHAGHAEIVEILVDLGAVHAAVLDALFPAADDVAPMAERFAEASCAVAEIFRRSWAGGMVEQDAKEAAGALLDQLGAAPLPSCVDVPVLEGYAYYGLYPETYLAAAERLRAERQPARVVCVGIRSIGASLAAVVAAELRHRECAARLVTVRPRGHPFERRPVLTDTLAASLRRETGSLFAIIDEGPGLSGSSLCGTAETLVELGIAEEQIVLLPSWAPDGASFVSASARRRWPAHEKYVGSFEADWIARTALRGARDISGGRWRALFPAAEPGPPVHPQHERRKYLCPAASAGALGLPSRPTDHGPILLKFAGLGRRGRQALSLAHRLGEAGFVPPVLGLWNGFLATSFVAGAPLGAGEWSAGLARSIGTYLAYRARNCPGRRSVSLEALESMIRRNIGLALGEESAAADAVRFPSALLDAAPVVAIDGRMLPHEWIRTSSGYVKTDAVDHHDDHFLPGDQDIAWDVAGVCVEFELGQKEEASFVRQLAADLGDRTLAARLPYYRLAYLAFRVGYTSLGAQTLCGTPDGRQLAGLATQYADALKTTLSAPPFGGRCRAESFSVQN